MPNLEINVVEELDLRILRVNGAQTYNELLAWLEQAIKPPIRRNLIWVIAPGSLQLLSTDDLKKFLSEREALLLQAADGQTAFVIGDEAEQALTKWYIALAGEAGKSSVQFMIATSEAEGLDLIKGAANSE